MAMNEINTVLYNILQERLEYMKQLDKEEDSEKKRHIAKESIYQLFHKEDYHV